MASAASSASVYQTALENYLVSMARTVEGMVNRSHATNVAEDVVFWLRGFDIRHGRANSFDFNKGAARIEEL